jgi:ArsR family transcriptional regulator
MMVDIDFCIDDCQYPFMTKRVRVLPTACCAPVLQRQLTAAAAERLATAFKAVADPARLRLLSFIAAQPSGETCVCNLTKPLGLSQPTVSHHLRVLFDAGLLERERRGTWVYYRIVRRSSRRCATFWRRPTRRRSGAWARRVMRRRLASEALGTALLLAAVVGSGIMGERLAAATRHRALANTLATGAVLAALIYSLAAVGATSIRRSASPPCSGASSRGGRPPHTPSRRRSARSSASPSRISCSSCRSFPCRSMSERAARKCSAKPWRPSACCS